MRGRLSRGAELMREHGVSTMMLARVLGVGDSHVFKYTNGHRPLSAVMMSKIRREFPVLADELIRECGVAFEARRIVPVRVSMVSEPRGAWRPLPSQAESDWDGELYTIGEWRELFGEPGSSIDPHGRVEGFFSTEPCFLGE